MGGAVGRGGGGGRRVGGAGEAEACGASEVLCWGLQGRGGCREVEGGLAGRNSGCSGCTIAEIAAGKENIGASPHALKYRFRCLLPAPSACRGRLSFFLCLLSFLLRLQRESCRCSRGRRRRLRRSTGPRAPCSPGGRRQQCRQAKGCRQWWWCRQRWRRRQRWCRQRWCRRGWCRPAPSSPPFSAGCPVPVSDGA